MFSASESEPKIKTETTYNLMKERKSQFIIIQRVKFYFSLYLILLI